MTADSVSPADLPVEGYLRGTVGYQVGDDVLGAILFRRKVPAGSMAAALSVRQLDLCTADLYLWCASCPGTRNNAEDSDGGWKHVEAGWQASASDKIQLRAMAREMYEKWGEKLPGKNIMRIVQFGVR